MKTTTSNPTPRTPEYFSGMPTRTWSEVVRSRIPEGCRAHRVEVQTTELLAYTDGFEEAWSVWCGPTYLGILARGSVWQWTSPFKGHARQGARETILACMNLDAQSTIDFLARNTADTGKTPSQP